MSDDQNLIKTEEEPRTFYCQIPNMVDDMGLTVYAYRLYGHLRRVAGESGVCWQGTSKMAEVCGMSAGKVTDAKKELAEKKLIYIALVPSARGEYAHHEITIANIWRKNHAQYSTVSPHERTVSPHERTVSPGETKNNPLRITHKNINTTTITETPDKPNPGAAYTAYINMTGDISPRMAEVVGSAIEDYTEAWVIEAIHQAEENNVRKWTYVNGILKAWRTNGYKADTRNASRSKKKGQALVDDLIAQGYTTV